MNKQQRQILLPSISIIMLLLIAILPIKEYGYYVLLKWVVFLTSIYIGYFFYRVKKMNWIWLMGIIAAVFNPIMPIPLGKSIWRIIDFITALIFGITIFAFRGKEERKETINVEELFNNVQDKTIH